MSFAKPERVLITFLFFSLFFFSYLYFFPFNEGVSSAPALLKALKDVVYLIAVIALLPAMRLTSNWREWIFIPFLGSLVLTSILHAPQTGLKVQLWQNIKDIAIFIPIYHVAFWMDREQRDELIRGIFTVLVFAAVIQSLFSFAYYWSGHHLWLGAVFAGLIGNPNSFSLMINLAMAVLLVRLAKANSIQALGILAAIALFAATVLYTTSGSQFAIFVFLIPYTAIFRLRQWKRYLGATIVVAGAILVNQTQVDNTAYTVSNIGGAFYEQFGNHGQQSAKGKASVSVTNRLNDIKLALSVLSAPKDAMLGSYSDERYTPMDGQFWVLLYNNGLIGLLGFAIPAAFIYLSSIRSVWRQNNSDLIALHLIVMCFGVTFLASRVLMYFPFNFIFFLACGLLVASEKTSSARKLR